jgi:quercetin dioxygenase-like cupin family protein
MIHLGNCDMATRQPFITAPWMAAAIALGTSALMSAPALASPGSGITSTVLATGDLNETVNFNHDRVKFQTKDPTDVRVQRLDFAAGAFTGWHHHPGIVIVTVASGLITIVQADCSTKTYGPGSPNGSVFVEGHDEPMEARSTAGGTVYATYVAPDATPPVFRIEDPAQTCSSATSFRTPPGK